MAVPMFAGQHYMMNAEIAPLRQQVENVEAGLGGLEGRFERFSEAMADFRVAALTRVARNESSRQTSSDQSDGGHEGRSDSSPPQLDGSVPTVPIAGLVRAEHGPGC